MLISSGVFRGLKVNCGDGSLYVRDDILEAIYTRLRFMTECHPFVLILRYDLRFPQHAQFDDYRYALQNFMNCQTASKSNGMDPSPHTQYRKETSARRTGHDHSDRSGSGEKRFSGSRR